MSTGAGARRALLVGGSFVSSNKPDLHVRLSEPAFTGQLPACPHEDMLRELLADQREMKSDVHAIRDAVVGTPDKPGLGEKYRTLNSRVHSLEGARKKQATAVWTIFTGALGAAGIWLWEKVSGKV